MKVFCRLLEVGLSNRTKLAISGRQKTSEQRELSATAVREVAKEVQSWSGIVDGEMHGPL